MGKKHKLNRFIKWIKSDLPEEKSPVLLLSITRIPSSPSPPRRPCSLPLRGTLTYPETTNSPSETASAKWSLEVADTDSYRTVSTVSNSPNNCCPPTSPQLLHQITPPELSSTLREEHPPLPPASSSPTVGSQLQEDIILSDKNSPADDCCGVLLSDDNDETNSPSPLKSDDNSVAGAAENSSQQQNHPSPLLHHQHPPSLAQMDRSVDSIGTCSLDVDVSVDNGSDWSESSSVATLRSASILTPPQDKKLPSYLSLACTVNGYSPITNYDSCRLARSREVSPHRPFSHEPQFVSSLGKNTLSPPNMSHHQEFYSTTTSSKSVTYMSKTAHSFSSTVYSTEAVDGCVRNGSAMQNKFIEYKTNGNAKSVSETSIQHSYTNGQAQEERKSFIQQRVERLYGPGALAQGFFVSKRLRNGTSESDTSIEGLNNSFNSLSNDHQHSKTTDPSLKLSIGATVDNNSNIEDGEENKMKQSTSSPALPVLRHLRPEFRAQLPIISPRKQREYSMQKSSTVPTLKTAENVVQNGHPKEEKSSSVPLVVVPSKDVAVAPKESSEKNGHYFLQVLEKEIKRILALAEKAELELEQEDLPEEAKGYLRSASGKARLLASSKMQQFEGLCRNNITQDASVQFPTTNEDLQGFWDMVLLQVSQLDKVYEELDVLRANEWKEPEQPGRDKTDSSKTRVKTPIVKARPQSGANEAARKAREAARKQMIEDRRKAMRNQKQQEHQSIEIFVPETS